MCYESSYPWFEPDSIVYIYLIWLRVSTCQVEFDADIHIRPKMTRASLLQQSTVNAPWVSLRHSRQTLDTLGSMCVCYKIHLVFNWIPTYDITIRSLLFSRYAGSSMSVPVTKFSVRLYGSEKAVEQEQKRQEKNGQFVIHPYSNFRQV